MNRPAGAPSEEALTREVAAASGRKVGSLVDGEWLEGGGPLPVINPFTGATVAVASSSSRQVVSRAVAVAAAAGMHVPDAWARSQLLRSLRELILARRDRFIAAMMLEGGFALADVVGEFDRTMVTLALCAEEATRVAGEMIPLGASPGQAGRIAFTVRRPVGTVCAITPFNAPLNTVIHKIGPALAAGNCVVLKPSPFTPMTAALVCEAVLDAGFPPGMIALVHGRADVGAWLLEEAGIDFYSFTGSTAVGEIIARSIGLRRCHLELGSIASTILCADADLDVAVPKIISASFRRAGQFCTSTQRLYVESPIHAEVVERLSSAADGLVTGDPFDPATEIGPMISSPQAERAHGWVREAVAGGAMLLAGGERANAVLRPTVLSGVGPGMKVIDQEIFAPVVSVIPFDDLNAVFAQINALPYGLAAGIFTSRIDRGLAAADVLRVGGVHINEVPSSRTDAMPYGGVKASGFGREGPKYAIAEMTEERLVTIRH